MKRGFTLIELLGVFSIMAAVLLLSVPAITNMLKQSQEHQYEAYKNDIYLSAEAYISSHKDLYDELREENKLSYVTIKTLMASGYLKSTMLNPSTNKVVLEEANNVVIVYMNSKGLYVYEYVTELTEAELDAINSYEALTSGASSSEKEIVKTKIDSLGDSNIKLALLNKLGE